MATKVEMITWLLKNGHERDLYDLLVGASPYNQRIGSDVVQDTPSIELTKLVGLVREHLYFLSKFGEGKTHVIDNELHYFSYPNKLSEWLMLDAPGVHEKDLDRLYASVQ